MKIFQISSVILVLVFTLSKVVFAHGPDEQGPLSNSEPEIRIGRMSEEVVKERLIRFEGYSQINSIELKDNIYEINAIRDGEEVSVQVDPLVGTIAANDSYNLFLPLILKP